MPSVTATKRLQKELLNLKKNPVLHVRDVKPLEENIFEFHFCVEGPKNTPYGGGYYHGVLNFPQNYPLAPPKIWMITPSGRFQPNTSLCISITNYQQESWNPAWNVGTLITGLLSFMIDNASYFHKGAMIRSDAYKKQLALKSLRHCSDDEQFGELFPELKREIDEKLAENPEKYAASNSILLVGEDIKGCLFKIGVIALVVIAAFMVITFLV